MANNKLITVENLNEFKTKMEDEIPDFVQYSTMPTASVDLAGKIVQYTGPTTASYTNGFFYKCVPGSTAGTYEWIPVAVQEGGGNVVQSDWEQTDSTADDYIKNKPDIPEQIQYKSLPEPSNEYVGKTFQYTGSNSGNYIKGHFYTCMAHGLINNLTGDEEFWYSWDDVLGTAASKNVPSSGNAFATQVVMGNDTRLSDARTPTAHTHTKSEITDFPTLGTAAAKNSTNAVTANSTDLVESGAVKTAIDAAVSSAYHHVGTSTVAGLTASLLVAANEGNVYNITDSGVTTSDFIEGAGKVINAGDNVGVAKVATNTYKFDLLSGFVNISGKADKVSGATAGHFAALDSNGNLIDSGKTATDFAIQSDWNQTNSTATDYIKNKPTIPNVSNKADKVTGAANNNFAGLDSSGNLKDSGKKASDFATASHTHSSSSITAMTGYYKPSSTASIVPTDSLNEAIGKLEKGIESGGGDDPSVEVYKSEDFEPLSYTVGSTTYYCPRVTFPGTSTGKILAIKAMDANGVTRTFDPTYLMHFGMNLFSPLVTTGSWSSYKPDRVFTSYGNSTFGIDYLGDGGYHVHGTTTGSSYTKIGTVINPVVGAWGFEKLPIEALNPTIRCAHIQGQYAGLSIGGSNAAAYLNPIDEESPFTYRYSWDYSSGSSYNASASYRIYIDIYLIWEAGTYDCTFYPQITPKAINNAYSLYEKPFCLNDPALMTMPIMEKQGLSESLYTYSTSSSNYCTYLSYGIDSEQSSIRYPSTNAGNASCFGVIDYPIVHSGLNTFTYGWPNTNPNNMLKLEVYYKPNYTRKISDEISDIEYSISNGRLNKYFINGSNRLDQAYNTNRRTDTDHIWLSGVPHLRYNNPYLPKGILWLGDHTSLSSNNKYKFANRKEDITVTDGINQKWGINYIKGYGNLSTGDYFNHNGPENPRSSSYDHIWYNHRYFPSSEFYWSSPASPYSERCFGLPSKTSYTSTTSMCYKIIFDYDGWDDSPSFEQ